MATAFAGGEAHDFDGGADHAAGRSSPLGPVGVIPPQ